MSMTRPIPCRSCGGRGQTNGKPCFPCQGTGAARCEAKTESCTQRRCPNDAALIDDETPICFDCAYVRDVQLRGAA